MFTLPKLDYTYDSLEPFIDSKTMEIHHSKHHQTYVDKLNDVLKANPEFFDFKIEELLENINKVPDELKQKVINFGGGHANHTFFWKVIGPKQKNFVIPNSILQLKDEFNQKALTLFGSGWTWIISNDGKLEVMTTSNQDSPILFGKKPILTIDLWEHAYYLKYQNRRQEYIDAFWNIVNWDKVNELLS